MRRLFNFYIVVNTINGERKYSIGQGRYINPERTAYHRNCNRLLDGDINVVACGYEALEA